MSINWHKFDTTQFDLIERKRLLLQQELDREKTSAERNKLGQFATPTKLAIDILTYAKNLIPSSEVIRFLDPAFGTGSFYSALLRLFPTHQIEQVCGYEIDAHYQTSTTKFWQDNFLDLKLVDFTKLSPPELDKEKFNLIICNPPYIRHHHLSGDEKSRLNSLVKTQTNYRLNGLAGLYCYFLLLSQQWMSLNGLAGWLMPGEFLEVNYGQTVKEFLLKQVTLLHIHRFKPQQTQFKDALVSSVVIWFRNTPPPATHQVTFSIGDKLTNPEKFIVKSIANLNSQTKWTWGHLNHLHPTRYKTDFKLSDLFSIKRGIATGANKFFILNVKQVAEFNLPQSCLTPIFPSPRYLTHQEIEADEQGYPKIENPLFLLDCNLPEVVIKEKYPAVWYYLQRGVEQSIQKRYLCRHRSPWYAQEYRPPPPILCTYMGRFSKNGRSPFRFIRNHSKATAPNVYLLLYPKPKLVKQLEDKPQLLQVIWQILRQISPDDLIAEGRVYGGGLYKLEPNELANIKISAKNLFEPDKPTKGAQLSLF